MPKPCSRRRDAAAILTAAALTFSPCPADAGGGGLTGGATEWTQILNNGELVHLVGQSSQQINNQITQISQLAEQIHISGGAKFGHGSGGIVPLRAA